MLAPLPCPAPPAQRFRHLLRGRLQPFWAISLLPQRGTMEDLPAASRLVDVPVFMGALYRTFRSSIVLTSLPLRQILHLAQEVVALVAFP